MAEHRGRLFRTGALELRLGAGAAGRLGGADRAGPFEPDSSCGLLAQDGALRQTAAPVTKEGACGCFSNRLCKIVQELCKKQVKIQQNVKNILGLLTWVWICDINS